MTIRHVAALATALLVAACSGATNSGPAPTAAASTGLVAVSLTVPTGMGASPFDTDRKVVIPSGWTMSVFARVPSARLAAWAPDNTLLVSVPENGTVVRLVPD